MHSWYAGRHYKGFSLWRRGLAIVARQKRDRQLSLMAFATLMLMVSAPHLLMQEASKKRSAIYAEVGMIPTALQYATLQPTTCMSGVIITKASAYTCPQPLSTALSVTCMALVEG